MSYFPYLTRYGELEARTDGFEEDLLLLDDSGTVLEGRSATGAPIEKTSIFDTVAVHIDDAADFKTAKYGINENRGGR